MRRNCPEVPFDDIASDLLKRRFRPVTTDCGLARKVRQSDTLQMLRVEKHVPGDFCWIELATTDQTAARSEEHTSELQSQSNLVCRLLLEKKKTNSNSTLSLSM